MKFSDFYTNAIAFKDQGLRRLREQVERARISPIRIKRTTSVSDDSVELELPDELNSIAGNKLYKYHF